MPPIFQTGKFNRFIKYIIIFIILYILLSIFIINRVVEEEKLSRIFELNNRSIFLTWTLEGATRSLKKGVPETLLQEISRQPGMAWIAIVSDQGRILYDSNEELAGEILYTEEELRLLDPGAEVKGRFSPDDPDIYETWMSFRPGRFVKPSSKPGAYIFTGQDATGFNASLEAYARQLYLIAFLGLFSVICCSTAFFYMANYRSTRQIVKDVSALAGQIINNYPYALIATDRSGAISFCNPSAAAMFNLEKNSTPKKIFDLPFIDWNNYMERLKARQTILDEEQKIKTGEKLVPVLVSAANLLDGKGVPNGHLFILRDQEELNLLKEKLAQSKKMSAIGKLVTGLVHEIRNPLSSICGYAHYLGQKLERDPMGKTTANLLEEEAQRLNRVLSDLLGFARPQQLHKKCQAVAPILRKACQIAKMDADAKGVILDCDMPSSEIYADMDADKILQAVLNIILNAIQACSESCKVDVCLERIPASSQIRITVCDNGPGMDEQTRQLIFTPYFSTKAKGSGLGLPVSQQIIENHDGAIVVWSMPRQGSRFMVLLPDKECGHGQD